MAKKTDPFDKFREATLGSGNTLGAALSGSNPSPSAQEASPAPVEQKPKQSKNANRTLKSFHIDNDLFRKLGQLKYEMGISYDELYNEGIKDLLVKYGKL